MPEQKCRGPDGGRATTVRFELGPSDSRPAAKSQRPREYFTLDATVLVMEPMSSANDFAAAGMRGVHYAFHPPVADRHSASDHPAARPVHSSLLRARAAG